jgi:predicted RNA binding protein YcfA (HicA-like mRNA interferase family)
MPKLPVLKPQEVVSRLEALGFVQVRQRGAHKQFRHPDGRGTTVPFHKGSQLGRSNVPVDPKTNGALACRQGGLSNA